MNRNSQLLLFTSKYPYGIGESFVENELNILTKKYDKIYLFPGQVFGEKRASFNFDNVQLVELDISNGISQLSLLERFKIIWKEFRLGRLPWRRISYDHKLLLNAAKRAHVLKTWLDENQNASKAVFYSYWMDEWVTTLSILKRFNWLHKFITRAHRFDIYDEENSLGTIPFRHFQLKHVDQVYCVSQQGVDYMIERFPSFENKITCRYLGTFDEGMNTVELEDRASIVSCSNVKPVKRLDLLAEAMRGSEHKWIHLGGGFEFDSFKELIDGILKNNPNQKIELKGTVPNKEVHQYLKNNPINVFVNVSSSEGLPVSIMEAVSYGIPVVATDVGGTLEIVNEHTGILLPENPSPGQIHQAIESVIKDFNTSERRNEVRAYWQEHFDAIKNYESFAYEILEFQNT